MNNPLWLPEGSVRAILALGLVGSAIYGVFALAPEASGLLLGLTGAVLAFYFKARESE